MTPLTILFISLLASSFVAIVGYTGKQIADQLKSIANSVHEIKEDLGVLINDHNNLKEDHNELQRVHELEHKK